MPWEASMEPMALTQWRSTAQVRRIGGDEECVGGEGGRRKWMTWVGFVGMSLIPNY